MNIRNKIVHKLYELFFSINNTEYPAILLIQTAMLSLIIPLNNTCTCNQLNLFKEKARVFVTGLQNRLIYRLPLAAKPNLSPYVNRAAIVYYL
ncbi:MAG: hypothetical protein LBQ22_12050 [Bacteroidales bacterium]|jgi:hypothetical protein|nr:hypothetical protein [Bacteroidales bacterium]